MFYNSHMDQLFQKRELFHFSFTGARTVWQIVGVYFFSTRFVREKTKNVLQVFRSAIENKYPDWPEEDQYFLKGTRQSPINIVSKEWTSKSLPQLAFKNHNKCYRAFLANNGHTVKLHLDLTNDTRVSSHPTIFGGPLYDDYIFDHYHLHWGDVGEKGSEHAIDNAKFDAEIHAVYYKWTSCDLKAAVDNPNGIAVVTFFAQEGNKSCPFLEMIGKHARDVPEPGMSVEVDAKTALGWSNVLSNAKDYVTYPGSLTTHPYCENVVFILFTKPFSITRENLNNLRCLSSFRGSPLMRNFRKLQAKNGRPVVHCSSQESRQKRFPKELLDPQYG